MRFITPGHLKAQVWEGLYMWYDDYYDDDDEDKFLSGKMVIKNERFKKAQ